MEKLRAHPISKLRRLDRNRRSLLLRASLILTAASAAVAFLPFRHAIRFGRVPLGSTKVNLQDCVWAISAASRRLPWRTMCIEQGLALQRMLRSGGIPAALHYGARLAPEEPRLEAHVWVSVDGNIVIGGAEAGEYAEVATYQ